MKLCLSIGTAGRATLPLSNDLSYELFFKQEDLHMCVIYVKINFSLIRHYK